MQVFRVPEASHLLKSPGRYFQTCPFHVARFRRNSGTNVISRKNAHRIRLLAIVWPCCWCGTRSQPCYTYVKMLMAPLISRRTVWVCFYVRWVLRYFRERTCAPNSRGGMVAFARVGCSSVLPPFESVLPPFESDLPFSYRDMCELVKRKKSVFCVKTVTCES